MVPWGGEAHGPPYFPSDRKRLLWEPTADAGLGA